MTRRWIAGAIAAALFIMLLAYYVPKIVTTEESSHSWSLPLAGKTIVIDPGHGGVDGGAEGSDGTQEAGITLAVSKMLRDYLQQAGALVYLTREEDVDLADAETKGLSRRKSEDIRNRVAFIEEKEADFYISIHTNALLSSKWSGAQTFFNEDNPGSKALATFIQDEIKRNLENTTRVPLALNTMYLLKHTEPTGALVEIGFMSNPRELELLKDAPYQEQMAFSIYEGILRYTTEKMPEDE
ncbi:N-acetylmuramoyl-L-alanine amidase CwlD [Terribacillus saccharophilus]|uniref:N-acetylmuramoyl-L-alanine amidase CwlD n=1 Tax=Terribacillus saccharophilus TaxID=361277 RepID=UPI0039835945